MASNFYQDPDDNKSYQKTVVMAVAAASMVILLFLVILYVNSDRVTGGKSAVAKEQELENDKEDKGNKKDNKDNIDNTDEDDILADSHNITSDELEFWDDASLSDLRPTKAPREEEGELTPYRDPSVKDKDDKKDKTEDGDETEYKDLVKDADEDADDDDEDDSSTSKSSSEKKRRDDNDEDQGGLNNDDVDDRDDENDDDDGTMKGDYLTVTDDKGNKKRYEILSSVPKNDYDLKRDLTREDGELKYRDNKREAVKGVDLSKYNGTVDFNALKNAGVDFAMLRLGSRGYGTGVISLDEKFVEYAQNARLSGIQIGAYFYSQAVNETEAVEEANYIVGAVSGFDIKYPIAIDVEHVSGDEARTDNLTSEERTKIVKTFCDTVKGYGYKPIVYATRDMLISGIDLEDMGDYDVWLSDQNVPTDYPYRFSMWQYDRRGTIDGITGDIDLNLSFINYEQK